MDGTFAGELGGPLFPDEVNSRLASTLAPGETIVWSARPQAGAAARRALPKALVGIAVVGFTLAWMAMVVRGGGKWDRGQVVAPFARHNVAIAVLAGLWMLPLAFFMLTWPLRAWRRARRTVYALTNQRAIVLEVGSRESHSGASYGAEALALVQCDERGQGRGDLVFENRKTWVGMSEPVGFLGIERVREVEELVRRTRGAASNAGSPVHSRETGPVAGERSYRIGGSFRMYQAIALTVGGISAFCLLGNILVVLVAGALLREKAPALIASLVAEAGWKGPFGVAVALAVGAGSLAITGLLAWMSLGTALGTPTEILTNDDGDIELRSWLRTIALRACDISAVVAGGWPDLNGFYAVIRHKSGKVVLINQFPEFREFLGWLRALNPAVEIKGF